jgi:hypothetical protein
MVSTPFLDTSLVSTVRGLGSTGYISTATVISTVQGLGSAGYISSFSSFSTLISRSTSISSLFTQSFYATQGTISSLIIDSLSFGSNVGFLDLGDIIATSLSTIQINTSVLYASSIQAFHVSGAITTLNLVSTTQGIQYNYQTAGFLSTPTLQSTVRGLGSAGYVSTASLVSTTSALFYGYQTAGFISSATLTSTVGGLGNIYISTVRSTFLTLSTGSITASSVLLYDTINSNYLNSLNVNSTLLYFNTLVVGGARVAQGQVFTF